VVLNCRGCCGNCKHRLSEWQGDTTYHPLLYPSIDHPCHERPLRVKGAVNAEKKMSREHEENGVLLARYYSRTKRSLAYQSETEGGLGGGG
jgi:hypothetical protein